MRNTPSGSLVFYPHYCFQHSPTYNTWARLTAADVHALRARPGFEGQNTYFHLNHPISWVRLVGVIVAFDIYPNRATMTLDDSSGSTIDLFCRKEVTNNVSAVNTTVDSHGAITLNGGWKPRDDEHTYTTNEGYKVNLQGIDIGSVVKVKGGISEFRGDKQVTLERICISHQLLSARNATQLTAWTENATFYQDILSKPWVVSEYKQQQARIEAEGVEREREARREQRKRKKRALEAKQKQKAQKSGQDRHRKKSGQEVERKREARKGERSSTTREEKVRRSRQHHRTEARQPGRQAMNGT
ncbi:MAG: hypothetical protein L6R39_002127 [Caloplaca ligustica]|nr:MAG: hypothetical protein L6R39_002127 [Caloplaca ligustica]